MKPVRNKTLVLDTSILPKRPEVADIKKFLDKKVKLDYTTVRSIQLHNIKNVVFLGMTSMEEAERIASMHHLKHYMECKGKQITIPVPIYVETNATDVRLHDLPEEIDNETIQAHLSQFGEVISIRNDVWKNFFPGLLNNVRVAKIKLARPIPSYVTIDGESSLVTYKNQAKTCKTCGQLQHVGQRCSDTKPVAPSNKSDVINNSNEKLKPTSEEQWPSLLQPQLKTSATTKKATKKNHPARHAPTKDLSPEEEIMEMIENFTDDDSSNDNGQRSGIWKRQRTDEIREAEELFIQELLKR